MSMTFTFGWTDPEVRHLPSRRTLWLGLILMAAIGGMVLAGHMDSRFLLTGLNLGLLMAYLIILWRLPHPVACRTVQRIHEVAQEMQAGTAPPFSHRSLQDVLAWLECNAKAQVRLRHDLTHQLQEARSMLARAQARQDTALHAASREMLAQYHAVLGFANYLDERVAYPAEGGELRQDFDDICESAFQLKLVAYALEALGLQRPATRRNVRVSALLQSPLPALSSCLDRRVMHLDTRDVDMDICVTTDPTLIHHVVWMALLGIIRHAAPESTLVLSAKPVDDGRRAVIGIGIRAPSHPIAETPYTLLTATVEQDPAALFAHTVREHASLRLAELLLQSMDAELSMQVVSASECVVQLSMPL